MWKFGEVSKYIKYPPQKESHVKLNDANISLVHDGDVSLFHFNEDNVTGIAPCVCVTVKLRTRAEQSEEEVELVEQLVRK